MRTASFFLLEFLSHDWEEFGLFAVEDKNQSHVGPLSVFSSSELSERFSSEQRVEVLAF